MLSVTDEQRVMLEVGSFGNFNRKVDGQSKKPVEDLRSNTRLNGIEAGLELLEVDMLILS